MNRGEKKAGDVMHHNQQNLKRPLEIRIEIYRSLTCEAEENSIVVCLATILH